MSERKFDRRTFLGMAAVAGGGLAVVPFGLGECFDVIGRRREAIVQPVSADRVAGEASSYHGVKLDWGRRVSADLMVRIQQGFVNR